MQNTKFEFRAIQMDLARQPETIDFIKKEIDFYSSCGYNYLVLYLEGRIRTSFFHPFPDNMSYSQDEMRDVVRYAASKGMETIPVISLLGHAEHFLMDPENEKYAELKNGMMGRYGTRKHVFCPSNPEVLEFIDRYITEVASVFPSKYFHAGFDEAWDIGFCDKCREREKKEGQSGIFAAHINAIHELITGKLGKVMMMWDDLFDIYPDALPKIPRDIILCGWHYSDLEQLPYGHAGGPRRDQFKLYDEMGFRYLFAPASFSMRNIRTLTDYAAGRHPFGAFLTIWECPNACDHPSVYYAGHLWSPGLPEVSMEDAIRAMTPLTTEAETKLALYYLRKRLPGLPGSIGPYLASELNDVEFSRRLVCESALDLFRKYRDCDNDVMKELLIYIDAEKIYFDLRALLPGLCDLHHPQDISSGLAQIKAEAKSINDRRKAMEKKDRPDRMSTKNDRVFDYFEKFLAEVPVKGPLGTALLRIRFPWNNCGPKFFVRYENESPYEWHEIPNVCTSGQAFHPDENLLTTPFEAQGVPAGLRIEYTDAYVKTVIMYAEIETLAGRYVPAGITNLEGNVAHPEALLNDGRDFAVLGDGEVQAFRKFNQRDALKMVSCVELSLKKA